MSLEKKYLIASVRAESKEVIVLEVVDESSEPPVIKSAVFRIGVDEYAKLGFPAPAKNKVAVKIEVEASINP